MISKPISLPNGTWAVQTSHGIKIFSEAETAHDFYLINKNRELKSDGNSFNSRQ